LFQNAMQSGSDRLFDQVFLYNNIWSPFTMVHKYQRNTRPADKRDASSRQYVAPYIAISLENVMFHFYEATSQFNDYYKERAFKREEPRNCLGTQMEAAPQNQEKPLERFMEHQAAGHVNTQSTNDQLTCMGSGYTYWTVAGPGGDTVYAAQLAAPAAVVGWDAINSRVLEKQEPTQQLIEQYDYIQFIKPYFEYKKDEIKGDPSHFLGHMPNPDDLPKDSPNAGWPKGCRDRYVEDKQIGPQSHTASPKHDFNTDYIAASTVLKGKSPANHYVLTGWTNVWGCPYDYAPLGEKDGEIEKLS
ncbi:MAG: hypothetical protein KDD62_10655, partial [Bdellovibrionales bacterium]|nr:hypothetical protein [Bdellovibrionales bacterium]